MMGSWQPGNAYKIIPTIAYHTTNILLPLHTVILTRDYANTVTLTPLFTHYYLISVVLYHLLTIFSSHYDYAITTTL